jgi:large subunit ribosomal protein L24e
MEINECWFCGSRIYPGHGSLYVKNNCEVLYFCRSKCKKLFKLGKNPSFLRWCNIFRERNAKTTISMKKVLPLQDYVSRIPDNYNNTVFKFMLYAIKRINKQCIKKNTIFLNLKKKNSMYKVV